jgi:hypothetical protein
MTEALPVRTIEEHNAHSLLAQHEMLELMARLQREGMDWRVILPGAAAAIAQMVHDNVGPLAVGPHFLRIAKGWAAEIAKDLGPED